MDRQELGVLTVDCGDVACIPMDGLKAISNRTGGIHEDLDGFIQELNGIRCAGGDVRSVTACCGNGSTYHAVVIGMDTTGLKSNLIGEARGEMVLVARDDLLRLLERGVAGVHCDDIDSLLEMAGGFECGFAADGGYGVEAMEHGGSKFVSVGLIDNFVRFLRDGEETFEEFYRRNPPNCGSGDDFDEAKFKSWAKEHERQIREGAAG